MVEVICDTNFVIHLANKKIRNFERIELDIGQIEFLIPMVVETELLKLREKPHKQVEIDKTLKFIKNLKKIEIYGNYADKEILNFIKTKKSFVGTMDKELKRLIKSNGSSIISFNKDFLVLQS